MKKFFVLILMGVFFCSSAFAATITSNGTGGGSFSAGATWAGGVEPANGDAVVIAAGDAVLMDRDTSADTGFLTVTITGTASGTPGMLYFKDGTSGYLKIRTGYSLVGTNHAVKGRLLANSDGIWGNTGDLAFANKAIISLVEVSEITATYLDINLRCTSPINTFVRTYYDKYATASIDTGTNVITMASAHGWAANRAVSIRSSGTLPAPLLPDVIYYVGSPSGSDLKLLDASSGTEIDITDSGTGTIEIYSGYETYAGVTTVNVLEDISADTPWLTFGDGTSNAVLSDVGPGDYDQQRIYITGVTSSTVTLSAALDSAQYPGARITLATRNVEIISSGATSSQNIINGSVGNYFKCSVRNTAGSGTTFYGYGLNSSSNNILTSCIFSGLSSGLYSGSNNTLTSCVLSGLSYGLYNGNSNTLTSCVLSGMSYGLYYSGSNNTLTSCVLSGMSYGLYSGSNNTLTSCVLSGMTYGLSNASNNTLTSCTFSGLSYGLYSNASNNTLTSCTFSGLNYYYRLIALNNIFRNCLSSTNINSYSLNANYTPGRIKVENLNRIDGAHKIFDNFGNIVKTACDGTGDTPSVDPDGSSGYCISAENIQSNCNSINPLVILEEQKIWLTATEHTVTYKLQTTYAGITAGNLTLSVQYLDTGGAVTTATHAPAILQRSADTDWTQTLTVTFTSAVEGWIRVRIVLTEYELGNEVYVWPIPAISGKTFTSKWIDGEPALIDSVTGSIGGGSWGY